MSFSSSAVIESSSRAPSPLRARAPRSRLARGQSPPARSAIASSGSHSPAPGRRARREDPAARRGASRACGSSQSARRSRRASPSGATSRRRKRSTVSSRVLRCSAIVIERSGIVSGRQSPIPANAFGQKTGNVSSVGHVRAAHPPHDRAAAVAGVQEPAQVLALARLGAEDRVDLVEQQRRRLSSSIDAEERRVGDVRGRQRLRGRAARAPRAAVSCPIASRRS